MTPTAASTPPTPNLPKASVNEDESRNDRDEPLVSSERPQPGAFPVVGPDGRSRRNSSIRSGSDASDEALETRDRSTPVYPRHTLVQNEDENSAMVLVEANLVTPSDNGDVPVVEGQAVVEQSAADRKRKQRGRLFLILGLVLVVAGIAVGVTLGITLNRRAPSSASPYVHPTIRQFQDSLPQSTVRFMQDPRAPHYLAWEWLTANDDYLNWDLWKLRQRFALNLLPLFNERI